MQPYPGFWGSLSLLPPALLLRAVGRDRGREQAPLTLISLRLPSASFKSSSSTQKPTMKTSIACLSKTEHSLAHEEKGVGKLCHSAIWRYLPKPSRWQGLRPPRHLIRRRMLSPGPWLGAGKCLCPPKLDSLQFFAQLSGLL